MVATEATFVKRAKGRIAFTCEDIGLARTAIEETLVTGESIDCDMRAVGRDSSGDTVSEWVFTWNFRAR